MADQLVPTLLMAQDPRLRRLFALVGQTLAAGALLDPGIEDRLRDVLLDLAPEYLPPDEMGWEDDDSPLVDEWNRMVREAIRG